MNEELNLNNEEITEVEDFETEEQPEEEQESNSLKPIVMGALGIGAIIGAIIYIKKRKMKWAIKMLEKQGYTIEEPDQEDLDAAEEDDEDSDEE